MQNTCVMLVANFDIHIYGVPLRNATILSTASKLSLPSTHIHYDDRPKGGQPAYTARKAWLSPIPSDITHRIVLQDDVEVCNNFTDIAVQIMNRHPDDMISFFPFNFMEKNTDVENLSTPYFIADTLSACGIMMPVEYIQPCFDYIHSTYNDECTDDGAIQEWAMKAGVRILTTIPALIQHIGDESIYNPTSPIRRTVYYSPNPQANWASNEVAEYRLHEWFFSNHGKPRTENQGVLRIVSE